nr:diguanylate cyclase [Vibrio splendidus]
MARSKAKTPIASDCFKNIGSWCAALSEKLRSAIQKIKLEQQPTLTITSSFGISLLSENEKWKDCVDRADRALYQAKLKGRNTIVIEESYDSYSTSTKAIGSS